MTTQIEPARNQAGTAVAPTTPKDPQVVKVLALRSYLEHPNAQAELLKAMPRRLDPKYVVRQTITLCGKNPDLLECTPMSILQGILQACELNLDLSGPLGHSYLVPRWNGKKRCKEAVFQIGYKGLISLVNRTGKVAGFHLRTVYERDNFAYQFGSDPRIDHLPFRGGDPGEPTHYYAIAFFQSGGCDFEVWTKDEVDKHRQQYSPPPQGKTDYSAWATAYNQMAEKTVARALCARLPQSVALQRAVCEDIYAEAGLTGVEVQIQKRADRGAQVLEALGGPQDVDLEPAEDAEARETE